VTLDLQAAASGKAGVSEVPTVSIPARVLDTSYLDTQQSAALTSIALTSIALTSINTQSSALTSIALTSIALTSIALTSIDINQTLYAQILLSQAPLTSTTWPGGWDQFLAGTTLGGVPTQTITFAELFKTALTDSVLGARVAGLDLRDVDFSATAIGLLPAVILGLADVKLSALGISCADVDAPSGCTDSALGEQTPLSAALTSIDTGSAALTSIALTSIDALSAALTSISLADLKSAALTSIALTSIALTSIDLEGTALTSIALTSIAPQQSALTSIALTSIALTSIANCVVVDCSSNTTTLHDLALIPNSIQSTATLGDFLDALGTSALTSIDFLDLLESLSQSDLDRLTLGEVFPVFFQRTDLPWEQIDLAASPLQNVNNPLVPPVTYTVAFTVNQTASTTLTIDLPDGFVVARDPVNIISLTGPNGTTTYEAPASATNAQGEDATGPVLVFNLGSLPGGSYTFTLAARAGLQLGTFTATATLDATAGTTSSAFDSTDVNVVETNSGSQQPPLDTSKLFVSYISSPGDVDVFTLTVDAPDQTLELSLGNLRQDYDLVLYGPSPAPLRGTPAQSVLPLDDQVLPADPEAASPTPDLQRDVPLTPPGAGAGVLAVAASRGNTPEKIVQAVRPGTYYVQVSGYNGAHSDLPYALRARLRSTALAACTARPVLSYGTPASISAVAPDVNTLFVVSPTRMIARGLTSDAMAKVDAFLTDPRLTATGVKAAVLNVDVDATLQGLLAAWDADLTCSPDKANDVARRIGQLVDAATAGGNVDNIVLVGDDYVLPMFRLADGTSVANEDTYNPFGGNNPLVGSLARSYFLSDDPYATAQGIDVNGTEAFVQERAIGRLVESKTEIVDALERFLASGGKLDNTTANTALGGLPALVSGYDFLSDGAQAVASALTTNGAVTSSLINESWTAVDLATALSNGPSIASVNAHFDHYRALPANENAAGTETDLFTFADLPTGTQLDGSLLFSMGCHAGLSVSDFEVTNAALNKDWAETLAGKGSQFIGNTGYGYGDSDLVLYSERLMALFAQALDGTHTVGEAMAAAKRQYAKTTSVWSPYDMKAVQQSTTYGLPMYRIGGTGVTAPSNVQTPLVTTSTPLAAPLASVEPTKTFDLDLWATRQGPVQPNPNKAAKYYRDTEGGVLAVKDRPVEPLAITDVSQAGTTAHGAVITALTSQDIVGFTPYYAHANVDLAKRENTGEGVGNSVFPSTLTTLTRDPVSGDASLLFSSGQFRQNDQGNGVQRLFDDATVEVYYSDSTDFVGPTIQQSQGIIIPIISGGAVASQTVQFDVKTAPDAVKVYVLYKPLLANFWRGVWLVQSQPGVWTNRAPVEVTADKVEFLVQACDANGNCSTSNNKAENFLANRGDAEEGGVQVEVSGPSSDGWFTGTATVEIIDGVSYTVNNGPVQSCPAAPTPCV
ncbi:MAG TPA: C25 family cysteine peptidase, partial [Acidimicrobiales bacterium]